jgi:hypothetical protein
MNQELRNYINNYRNRKYQRLGNFLMYILLADIILLIELMVLGLL